SQISAYTDFGISFAAFAWLHTGATLSAALGAVGGGITNCALNYKWTFHSADCPVSHVAVKYGLVWIGSLLLNSYGTDLFYRLMQDSILLDHWHVVKNLRFTMARLGVSLSVSVFWNLLLQKLFVYRNVGFDRMLDHQFASFRRK
ncbi:MAG: GtrA family protein, partial [Duncaniella sp.]|nr:GtrA family protein [Duncaniella sp.]